MRLKELLINKYKAGVRVTLCTKVIEEYSDRNRKNISNFINTIEEKGIGIIQVPNNHLKFMVVDNKIVWYGGIDILGENYNDNSIIRIQNESLANELIGALSML